MRPHEQAIPQTAVPPRLSPLRDDRVRMGIYAAVLVQIVLIYAIFAWWI